MAAKNKNLSNYDPDSVPSAKGMTFGIVVAEWNKEITNALLDGAYKTLIKHGASDEDITIKHIPGTFELTFAAKALHDMLNVDTVICIGCVIQGETKHFDYICQSVTHGITELNIQLDIPVIYGVLTTNNFEQAKERAGGKHGNKGVEAAITAIKMVSFNDELFKDSSIGGDEYDDYFDDEFLN